MTFPIQSAKTAKEMLEAVCEDLEALARDWEKDLLAFGHTREWKSHAYQKFQTLQHASDRYRAILKEME